MSDSERGDDDRCHEAFMASLGAMGTHCGDEQVPVEVDHGIALMAPKDGLQRVRARGADDMDDEQLMQMVENSPWLSSWTQSLCSSSGHEEGTSDYRECRLRFARQVLEE